jgi:uncharacterized protein (TIGR00375 family)
MEFIADLHIHSKYSRATSNDMVVPKIAEVAELKGINLVGTGDFTHPQWLDMLRANLTEQDNGIFKFNNTYFILTVEVNNIYQRHGKLRRIHNVLFAPSFESVHKINQFLAKYGNLNSDGRPLLSLDSKDMLEKILEIDPSCFLIPSHIWTPWFSLFGSKSGFNSIEECFGELSSTIFAVETGLSSDPAMNWTLSVLDNYTLISNSDAHSPSRLGREANVFDCKITYDDIKEVLKIKDKSRFLYTIEFFPEEGKYHYDGHRNCNVCMSPQQSMAVDDICPVCGKLLTIGVAHRVRSLADREQGFVPSNAIPYKSLVPLEEIIAEALNMGRDTVTVKNQYQKLVTALNGEFNILLSVPIADISAHSDERIAYAVNKVRKGDVIRTPGYDGVFGKISVFSETAKAQTGNDAEGQNQMQLF